MPLWDSTFPRQRDQVKKIESASQLAFSFSFSSSFIWTFSFAYVIHFSHAKNVRFEAQPQHWWCLLWARTRRGRSRQQQAPAPSLDFNGFDSAVNLSPFSLGARGNAVVSSAPASPVNLDSIRPATSAPTTYYAFRAVTFGPLSMQFLASFPGYAAPSSTWLHSAQLIRLTKAAV